MLEKKITFIGSGAMAEAMISSLLRQNLARPENLQASLPIMPTWLSYPSSPSA
jgi:pyrroline-5-carboxylate reductase